MSFSLSKIYLNFISISIFTLFISAICQEEPKTNPNIIQKYYFKISHLLSGQTFKQIDNNIFLICTYDSDFSDGIKFEIDYNNFQEYQKYFLCLTNSVSISYLYIFDNNETYSYKYELYNPKEIFLSGLNLNLIPNIDKSNNINFLISFFIPNNKLVYIQNYIINLTSNKLEQRSLQIKDKIFCNYYIGCGISGINENLACSFIYNRSIYLYILDIETGNKINESHIKCQNCLNENMNNSEKQFISSFLINKNENMIFSSYKFEGEKTVLYFYNIKNNLYKYNDTILECKNNLNNYYFYESEEYVFVCLKENLISIYVMDNRNLNKILRHSLVNIDEYKNLSLDNFALVYNFSINEYNLKYYCFKNETYKYIKIISESKINNKSLRSLFDIDNCILGGCYKEKNSLENIVSNLSEYLGEKKNSACFKKYNYFCCENDDYNLLFRPMNSSEYNDLRSSPKLDAEFEICEQRLQFFQNYTNLYVFILEIIDHNEKSLTNKIEYKIFDENLGKVNTSSCEGLIITGYYPLNNRSEFNKSQIDTIQFYLDNSVNLFDLSSPFFTDFCQIYPDLDYDVIREDRVKLFQPFFVCEDGCTLLYINNIYATCNCPFKNTFNPEIEKNYTFGEFPTEFPKNIEVVKCFKVVMSSDDKINNFGFYLITFMLGGHVPIWCYYLSSGVNNADTYITKEMTKFGYIEKTKKSKNQRLSIKNKKRKSSKKTIAINKNDKSKKPKNSSNPPKKEKGKKKSREKKKNSTYIHSCYIINNNNNNNEVKDKKIKKNKTSKTTKSIKSKSSVKKLRNSKIDNSSDIMRNSNKDLEPNMIETQNMEDFYYTGNEEEVNYDDFNFINIHLDPNEKTEPRKESNKVLNNYTFEEAVEYDKRGFFRIFYIFLLSKNFIFHTLILKSPFDSVSVQGCAFMLIITSYLFFNSLLYFNEIVSKRFHTRENVFLFTFSTNMPTVFYSVFIVYVFIYITFCLTNISNKIVQIFKNEEEKMKKKKDYKVSDERKKQITKEIKDILNTQNNKNYAFFVIELILTLLYWYYITAFCHIYSNTQYSWMCNTFSSIFFCFLIDSSLCLLLTILYLTSISSKSQSIYNFVLFIYNI